jgi:hypothetical protein
MLGIVVATEWKLDNEASAHSLIAALFYRNGATVGLDNALHNVQPDSGSSLLPLTGMALAGKTNESLENPLAVGDRHAGTFIGDRQKRLGTIAADIDGDGSSTRTVAHRVVEEVGEDTVKLEEVAFDDGFSMVDEPERYLGVSHHPRLDRLPGHPCQVDRLPIEIGTTLLDLPEVQQLVEEFDQSLRLFADVGHSFASGGIGHDRFELGQHRREPGDPGQGRSHVVADSNEKLESVGQHLLDF